MSVAETLVAGRYRLVRMIATGGMGTVWEAVDERLQRSVAVKRLHTLAGVPEAEAEVAKERAMREARITARLHHPHAVTVFDAVEHDGQPCLVMQLLPSTPLSAVIRDNGPVPLDRVARIGAEVASALAAAHALGIVHRDVKPGNVLITEDGASHISDFGISHALGDATLTRTGMLHGTPAYLAPEAARGEEAGFPADVFSLGSTLFAALEGAPPFGSDENSIALLHKVAAANVPDPENAGPLTGFLLDMLSPDPAARPTMAEVADRLAHFPDLEDPERTRTAVLPAVAAPRARENEQPATEELSAPAPPPGRGHRSRRGLVLLVAAVAVGLALLLAALTGNLPGTSDTGHESPAPSASSPRPTSASPTPSPTRPQPSPTTTPTATPTQSSVAPTPTVTPSATAGSAQQLAAAVTDYYGLLPDDTDAAWSRLTPGYQRNPSGGRSSFEAFGGRIRAGRGSGVQARPPDLVEATLRYTYDGGRIDVERTRFRLVEEGGILKIAGSEVLSSGPG